MYELLVAGRVVAGDTIIENGWVAIEAGRIAALGAGPRPDASRTEDYEAALLLPGAVDGQTHAGSQIGFAGMETTTYAAVIGGVTTIVDMPYDHPTPVTNRAVLAEKVAAIESLALCDVALYGTVPTTPNPEHIQELVDGGVCAFKISAFEAHPERFPRIGSAATLKLFKALEETGLPVGLHNEDQEIVIATTREFIAQGRMAPKDHSPSRPPVAELSATATFLELGAVSGAPVHIVHISLAEGFALVRQFRESGVKATAEMCLHYLLFDADPDMTRIGGLLKVNPPIRPGEIEALWKVIERGEAEFVSSDHSAWPLERKTSTSIFDVAAGMPGLETLLPGFFTAAEKRYGRDAAALLSARLLAEAPSQFFGLIHKGRLAPGYDADIAVLAPEPMVYDSKNNEKGPGWSAYDGMQFSVTPVATYVRGRKMWDGKTVASDVRHGRYVEREATVSRRPTDR